MRRCAGGLIGTPKSRAICLEGSVIVIGPIGSAAWSRQDDGARGSKPSRGRDACSILTVSPTGKLLWLYWLSAATGDVEEVGANSCPA